MPRAQASRRQREDDPTSWSCLSLPRSLFGACPARTTGSPAPANTLRQFLVRSVVGLRRDGFLVGRFPAPGARAVAALDHPLLVDLRDDLAVAGEQRLGRAHLGAQRQLAVGEAVRAVFLVLGRRIVRLRSAGAVGAFV